MSSENGRVSLSAIDFLGLAKQRKVARIDLSEVGYKGVIYVRDLTSPEMSRVTSGSGGKNRDVHYFSDKSYKINMDALMEAAGAKFLMAAAVTDAQDGDILERAFAAEPDAEYITIAISELVQMSEVWIREAGNRDKAEKLLEQMPNAVTNEVVKVVREISGMTEDAVEEKKDNS